MACSAYLLVILGLLEHWRDLDVLRCSVHRTTLNMISCAVHNALNSAAAWDFADFFLGQSCQLLVDYLPRRHENVGPSSYFDAGRYAVLLKNWLKQHEYRFLAAAPKRTHLLLRLQGPEDGRCGPWSLG